MRATVSAAAGILLALLGSAARGQEPPSLPVAPSLYLLDVPFLHLAGSEHAAPAPGELRLDAALDYGNTFSHTWQARAIHVGAGLEEDAPFTREEAEYMHREFPEETMIFLDGELTRVTVEARVGLGAGLSAGLRVPWLSFGALRLDGALESFHDAVGLPDSQRPAFPTGRFLVVLQAPGGPLRFDDRPPRSGIGDVVASLRYTRAVGASTRVTAELLLKAPTGDPEDYRGSGRADAGLLVGAVHRVGRLGLHLDAGVVVPGRFRNEREVPLATAPFARLLAGADVRLGSRTFLALWAVAEQSPQRRIEMGDVARAGFEAGLGITREEPGLGTLSLSLVENLPWFGDAVDLGLSLRLRRGF